VAAAQGERQDQTPGLADQYQALAKEFHSLGRAFRQATTDEQRASVAARVNNLTLRLLELAEKNPRDPVALHALVQVVIQEIWMENYTTHPGCGKDSPQIKAIHILLRDHVASDRIAEATRRVQYGFRRECETFLRAVLDKNPHRDIQGLACLRLAQFLNARLQRLDLLDGRPEWAHRYDGLFGKEYLQALKRQDRAQASRDVESVFERAAAMYGDVKLPFGGTVGEKAQSELNEIRHLTIGKPAQDIEGQDQEGKRFKLSDYRGKVVLLYFWSEY
jgi:hypothetical protein